MSELLSKAWRTAAARLGMARPVYAHYGVTHRCNMRCRMCVVWRSGDAAAELRPDQVERLAQTLRRAGVCSVALGGGEPFVRHDLAEVAAAFGRRGFEVRLLTNGVRVPEERIAEVVAAGVRHVSISLDSLDAAKERHLYNGQDVWGEIVETMRRFRRHLPERGSIPIMNVCVSALNAGELPRLVGFADSLGFACSFVPITLSASEEASDGFAAVAPDLAIRPEQHAALEAAYGRLLALKRRGASIANSSRFLRDSLTYLKTGRAPWRCDAGRLYLSVSPEGGISICHRFPPVARFDDPDLRRALGQRAVQRAARRQRSGCPGCMRPCWAEVTHAVWDAGGMIEAARVAVRSLRRHAQPPAAAPPALRG